jgi:excisionase family DNA binding protein
MVGLQIRQCQAHMLSGSRLRPVRDDHVRVGQLMTVGAVRRQDLGDAAVAIRPKLGRELLEHMNYPRRRPRRQPPRDRIASGYGSHHRSREVGVAARIWDLAAERLLTPAEVAELFKVNPLTVTRWANQGRIGSVRTLGGHTRYKEAEVLHPLHEAAQEAGRPGVDQR